MKAPANSVWMSEGWHVLWNLWRVGRLKQCCINAALVCIVCTAVHCISFILWTIVFTSQDKKSLSKEGHFDASLLLREVFKGKSALNRVTGERTKEKVLERAGLNTWHGFRLHDRSQLSLQHLLSVGIYYQPQKPTQTDWTLATSCPRTLPPPLLPPCFQWQPLAAGAGW